MNRLATTCSVVGLVALACTSALAYEDCTDNRKYKPGSPAQIQCVATVQQQLIKDLGGDATKIMRDKDRLRLGTYTGANAPEPSAGCVAVGGNQGPGSSLGIVSCGHGPEIGGDFFSLNLNTQHRN